MTQTCLSKCKHRWLSIFDTYYTWVKCPECGKSFSFNTADERIGYDRYRRSI